MRRPDESGESCPEDKSKASEHLLPVLLCVVGVQAVLAEHSDATDE